MKAVRRVMAAMWVSLRTCLLVRACRSLRVLEALEALGRDWRDGIAIMDVAYEIPYCWMISTCVSAINP